MKRLTILLFIGLFGFASCSKEKEHIVTTHPNGKPAYVEYFSEDDTLNPTRTLRYYYNGEKQEEISYKNGIKNGKNTFWYQNGEKMFEGNYADGLQDGIFTQWFDNGKVDYMVTDRPLIMSNMYHNFWMEKDWPDEWNEAFYKMVKETWDLYDNRVYLINRVIPYSANGRNENEEEALRQDKLTKKWLDDYGIDYYAAFVGCSAESEASFETILFLSKIAINLSPEICILR